MEKILKWKDTGFDSETKDTYSQLNSIVLYKPKTTLLLWSLYIIKYTINFKTDRLIFFGLLFLYQWALT